MSSENEAIKTLLLVNRQAGGGLGVSTVNAITRAMEDRDADIVFTDVHGARSLAYEIGGDYDCVWVAGGDGTISQLVHGLHDAALRRKPSIGLIPVGTGNDFAFSLGIAGSIEEVVTALSSGENRLVDYGVVTTRGPEIAADAETTMINCIGVGLDARVAAGAVKFKQFGRFSYVASALLALAFRDTVSTNVRVDSDEWDGEYLFVSVCNGRRIGGGFHMAPAAIVDDGLLDACLVENRGLLRCLRMLPAVKAGKHNGLGEVRHVRSRRVRIESAAVMPVHVDGEVLEGGATSVSVEIARDPLSFLVPKRS